VALTILTLSLVVIRPRGLNEGVTALLGAVLVVLVGLVSFGSAVRLELATWNVFLFFLGMMAIAAVADQSGVFDVVALAAARLAGGRIILLYVAIFVLGAVISLLFANDSAALVLTPIVYTLVVRLSVDPLPFVFATTFVADTASVGLPVSNPLNVILADSFHLGLGSYVSHLWLAAVVVVVINLVVFLLVFCRALRGRYAPLEVVEARIGIGSTFALLGVVAVAYLLASTFQLPVGPVAAAGALALALNLRRLHSFDFVRFRGDFSWPIFGFIGGMLLLVQGLRNSGVTAALGHALVNATGGSDLSTIAVTTVGTAIGSNLINNLPMSLVMTSTLHPLHVQSGMRLDMVYSTILGCDLGPNLTHLGSLATFIWLFFLRRKGVQVSTLDYFKLGIVVTPLMLVGAIFSLWVASR
jgi:arsenical pump membrane protein